jgi:hypothetical protein
MPWVRIESSVSRHPKFAIAGPAASWLWLCGVAYCQEGLTDGFIPESALNFLGVKNAKPLVSLLVKAQLWEVVDSGWLVHDYLEHNRSAEDVRAIKGKRKASGELGGRPRKQSNDEKQIANESSEPEKQTKNPTVDVAEMPADVVVVPEEEKGDPPFDRWLAALIEDYPQNRITTGWLTQTYFIDALNGFPGGPWLGWETMRANLENQKAGHEWRVKRLIPKLENWLRSGAWRQTHEEFPADAVVSDKTARTLSGAAAFIKAGKK